MAIGCLSELKVNSLGLKTSYTLDSEFKRSELVLIRKLPSCALACILSESAVSAEKGREKYQYFYLAINYNNGQHDKISLKVQQ